MARGSLFNNIEKGKILIFSDVGLNRTEIAREIRRYRNVVANFLTAPDEYGIKRVKEDQPSWQNGKKEE
uniref:HTH_Tnp_Tc3_1 domain-containing protein n=1 Tax=Heterorhabditis bacteriophora TaxID=37862 RepID=A0A1I7XE08_HETBA